jgi:fucose permease
MRAMFVALGYGTVEVNGQIPRLKAMFALSDAWGVLTQISCFGASVIISTSAGWQFDRHPRCSG